MEFEGIHNEVVKAGAALVGGLIKDTAQGITARIETARSTKDKEKTINSLEEIINELISDRNKLIQAVGSYEEMLITQKITDTEIDYITENIVPLLETLLKNQPDASRGLELIKPLLSKELLSILQLLGFNFKKAIGEPLTQVINSLIVSKIAMSSETEFAMQLAIAQRDSELYKIMQDEESFERFRVLAGKA